MHVAFGCQGICWEAVMLGYELYKLTALDLHDYLSLNETVTKKGACHPTFIQTVCPYSQQRKHFIQNRTL